MSCGHEFHLRCLVQWLQQPSGAGSCPCCRREPVDLERVLPPPDDDDLSMISSVSNATPLMDVILENRVNDFLQMLHDKSLLNMSDSNGDNALHYALIMNSAPMVAALLEAGIDPDHVNNDRETNLMYACTSILSGPIVRMLLDYGARTDLRDLDEWSALDIAASNNNIAALNVLLEHGVRDLDLALHSACSNNALLCAQALLDRGVDVNCRAFRGRTPLMSAVGDNADVDIVNLLLERGARVHDVDDDGWNAFMWLTESDEGIDSDVMAALLEAKSTWMRLPNGRWAHVAETWGEGDTSPPPIDLAELTRVSANKIQALWRGVLARNQMRTVLKRLGDVMQVRRVVKRSAASKIQAVWRGWDTRRTVQFARLLVQVRSGFS
jgi:ankyrin repeat protein